MRISTIFQPLGYLLCSCLVLLGCGKTETSGTSASANNSSNTATTTPRLESLAITPEKLSLTQGENAQLTATGTYEDGTKQNLTKQVRWSISVGVGALSASGQISALSPGDATATAAYDLLSATAKLEVTASEPIPASYETSVSPQTGEDLASDCSYELYLPDKMHSTTGVWVIFERADSLGLWQTPDLQALARDLRLALVYAHQCNAASYSDIQSDGRKGPARALKSALTQFASISGHPEIETANLGLFGFSAAGVLSLTTAEALPFRVFTVVAYASGSAPLELRQLTPSTALQSIPVLILGNSNDNMSGTYMSQQYFLKARSNNAPWSFAIQPGITHCCTSSTIPVLFSWMRAITPLRLDSAGKIVSLDSGTGFLGSYVCTNNGVRDANGYPDCTFTAAQAPSTGRIVTPTGMSWLPSAEFGKAWLSWVHLSL